MCGSYSKQMQRADQMGNASRISDNAAAHEDFNVGAEKKTILNWRIVELLWKINVRFRRNVDAEKQIKSFVPNFIQSLESTHMTLTSLYCERAGITFASVFDCFWTHAGSVDVMDKVGLFNKYGKFLCASSCFVGQYLLGRWSNMFANSKNYYSIVVLTENRGKRSHVITFPTIFIHPFTILEQLA